jgi:hypothetical protein
VLNEDSARPPAATLAAQQLRLDAWRLDYNNDRPHEALGQRCPATLCTPSPRASRSDGGLGLSCRAPGQAGQQQRLHQMARQTVYLTEALARQNVALAQKDDGDWSIRFRQFQPHDAVGHDQHDSALRARPTGSTSPASASDAVVDCDTGRLRPQG